MSRCQLLSRLLSRSPAILPSLLLCDFGNLEREVRRLEAAGVAALHLDVMDGHFVPNLTYGMPIVAALDRLTELTLDVHLMIREPERYVAEFVAAGADVVTIHCEAVPDAGPVLRRIRDLGACAGIACNPGTPLSEIEPYLDEADLVLVMSVEAGFGGQAFNPVALDKLAQLRQMVADDVALEVDGGINAQTVAACARAGAELFVVGSAIFRQPDYAAAVAQLRGLAESGVGELNGR
jgi:ribulose-phosphate 3-epimerase